jgi:hypothetical protein
MEPFRSDEAVVVRRNPALLAIPGLGVALGVLLMLLAWDQSSLQGNVGQFLAVGGVLASFAMLVWSPLRWGTKVSLEADERGVHADGVPLLPRSAITEGYVQPNPERPSVKLRCGSLGRRVEVRVKTAEEAHALLSALHLDAAQARVTFWAPSPTLVSLPLQLLFFAVLVAASSLNLPERAMLTLFLLFLFSWLIPRRIVAGADGVRIGWLGPGKFTPYADVHGALADGDDAVIALRSGARLRVPFKRPFRTAIHLLTFFFERQRAAMIERIEEGVLAHVRRVTDRDAAGLLARSGRTGPEWLKALQGIGSKEADYRAATMPPDLLWRIAENSAAPAHERAAAAVALRETLDDAGRARLHGLAEATAAPRVRIALEAAARSTDEEELARALEECEDDASTRDERVQRRVG